MKAARIGEEGGAGGGGVTWRHLWRGVSRACRASNMASPRHRARIYRKHGKALISMKSSGNINIMAVAAMASESENGILAMAAAKYQA